jgi:hypothetical protein
MGPRILTVAAQQFDVTELQKRILQKTKNKEKAKPAFYIDPRTLDHRLNLMFGGAWSVGFSIDQGDRLIVARATLNINGIVREDVSSESVTITKKDWDSGTVEIVTNELATTSAQAAAYKRAAVKFGISAYLYDFKDEIIWLPIDQYGFKEKDIKLKDLPQFARPIPGPQIVMDELIYLCGSEDSAVLKENLQKYWGIETLKDLNRDDSFMLASCVARVSDFLSFTGKDLDQLAEDRVSAAKSTGTMGFNRS